MDKIVETKSRDKVYHKTVSGPEKDLLLKYSLLLCCSLLGGLHLIWLSSLHLLWRLGSLHLLWRLGSLLWLCSLNIVGVIRMRAGKLTVRQAKTMFFRKDLVALKRAVVGS